MQVSSEVYLKEKLVRWISQLIKSCVLGGETRLSAVLDVSLGFLLPPPGSVSKVPDSQPSDTKEQQIPRSPREGPAIRVPTMFGFD
ncbi:MAG: hypothetical protein Q6364_11380 [Candidatus Hermodarchaeota archaeon]|nr:hypothetical protein [Candidatus Hermodarchaeota archaeon]